MKTILCFGDSNTFGTATRPEGDERYPPDERWPGVLQARLGPTWAVVAEGLPGRTTVHSDPIEGLWMNGAAYLMPCLKSHRPLDAVAIMLGTNDLKARFAVSPGEIARGVGELLRIVRHSESGPAGRVPKMLVLCPPPLADAFGEKPEFADVFAGGREKSLRLAPAYAVVAKEYGAEFLNAGDVIRSSRFDGIHFDADQQKILGGTVAEKIQAMGW